MKKINLFPEGSISKVIGKAIVLKGDDIDTDRIIPARFLKCIDFESLGSQVFADDRKELNGNHVFDKKIHEEASILSVNSNFGCGSSREHAPQALMRWGIRAIIGESFAEIFYSNCLAIGIPCVTTTKQQVEDIQGIITKNSKEFWELDLRNKKLLGSKNSWNVEIEKSTQEMLLNGNWDATSELMSNDLEIQKITSSLPYINNFSN